MQPFKGRKIRVAAFCMPFDGHFSRMRSVICGLKEAGANVEMWTHTRFQATLEQMGVEFYDLFKDQPFSSVDVESAPRRLNCVTFAAHQLEAVMRRLRSHPQLILYDSFAVIGKVLGKVLQLPHINICAGHNMNRFDCLTAMELDIQGRITKRSLEAVKLLRDRYGIEKASPFMVLEAESPYLNLYCEPEIFLNSNSRLCFEPFDCIGSVMPLDFVSPKEASFPPQESPKTRVYISFGTVCWKRFEAEALAALTSITSALRELTDFQALISLGGHKLDSTQRGSLEGPSIEIADYVDQKAVLREADIFVTHHGLNSTHEAIYCGVPMLSHPFHWDQPKLARKCQELEIAVSIGSGGPISVLDAKKAFCEARAQKDGLVANALKVRELELATIRNRVRVFARLLALGSRG